jgi:hypothetical protein
MVSKTFEKDLNLLVDDAEERAVAAKQLREIALRHPDLLRQAAKLLGGDRDSAECASASKISSRPRTRTTPTDAVRQWLKDHPEGGTSGTIVNEVLSRVRTSSDKPASVVYSTIAVMKRKREIVAEKQDEGPAIYKPAPSKNGTAH